MLVRFVCKGKSVDFHNGKQGVKIVFFENGAKFFKFSVKNLLYYPF